MIEFDLTRVSALRGDFYGVTWAGQRVPIEVGSVLRLTPVRSGMDNHEIARVCHEANRALQIIQVDPAPSPAWDDAPAWQRESAVAGVASARAGDSPEGLHRSWCQHKVADGWIYGKVKDVDHKTHPCLVEYVELPDEQKAKDQLFAAVVWALTR